MTTSEAMFGNLWHGKLGDGTVELVAGSPQNTIMLDGETKAVQTIAGNLGMTRYCKAPGLPAPTTPVAITAQHGELKNDFILYSSKFRYSPLSPQSVLPNAFQWLLYDGTAQRWRKMGIGIVNLSLSSSPGSPSAEGSNCLQVYVDRYPVVGTINHVQGDTPPAAGSSSFVGSQNLKLTYAYMPLVRPTSYPFNPTNRTWTIEPSPDGRKILIRMEAMRWNGYEALGGDGLPPGFVIYDASQTWIFNVWEITFSDDGSVMYPATEVWPDRPQVTFVPWVETQMTQNGSVFWEEHINSLDPTKKTVYYYVPLKIESRSNVVPGYETSIILNASYDKDGAIQLTHFRMWSENTSHTVENLHGVMITNNGGRGMLTTDNPADFIPSFWFDNTFHRYEPATPATAPSHYLYGELGGFNQVLPLSSASDTTVTPTYICKMEIAKGTTVLKSWSAPFAGPMSWRWVTNNVIELYTGTASIVRVGPDVVDDTPIAQGAYASWNPRTGQLVSSIAPIGFV